MASGLREHPAFNSIRQHVKAATIHAIELSRIVFRSAEPTYATKRDLLTGEGSRIHGGRWNPPHSFAAVYAAFSDTTALSEAKANHIYYGVDAADVLPRTLVAIDIDFAKVVNLNSVIIRKTLGVSKKQLKSDDWRAMNKAGVQSLTQAIGRAGHDSGVEGFIVPACDGGQNLVWFPDNLQRTSKATIRNIDKLV